MLLQELRKSNAAALTKYRQLVANAASGDEVDPDHAMQVAMSANRSIAELAADVELATRRREAMVAREARDFGSDLDAARKEHRESATKLAELESQVAAMHQQLRETRDRCNSASARISRLQREDKAAADALRKLMTDTAGPGSDPFAPANFLLS